MTQKAIAPCNGKAPAILYNAMIAPWAVGPMALTGFTWYQCVGARSALKPRAPPSHPPPPFTPPLPTPYRGESDLSTNAAFLNNNYTCTQPAMMQQWRNDFNVPNAFFGIVQLST